MVYFYVSRVYLARGAALQVVENYIIEIFRYYTFKKVTLRSYSEVALVVDDLLIWLLLLSTMILCVTNTKAFISNYFRVYWHECAAWIVLYETLRTAGYSMSNIWFKYGKSLSPSLDKSCLSRSRCTSNTIHALISACSLCYKLSQLFAIVRSSGHGSSRFIVISVLVITWCMLYSIIASNQSRGLSTRIGVVFGLRYVCSIDSDSNGCRS